MIPTPLSRVALLNELKSRITAEVKDAWLFPQRGVVGGYFGTGPIVIVGWRPSWSVFSEDGANKLFYEILAECGLENSHLTNVVKSRGRKGEPDPEHIALHTDIFRRELEIVSPPFAVAPMGDAYERVATLLLDQGVRPIAKLPQYASMQYGPDRIAAFRTALAQLAATAMRNKWIP